MSLLRRTALAAPLMTLALACSGSDATIGGVDTDASSDAMGGTDGATDAGGSGDGNVVTDSGGGDGATGDASADAAQLDAPTEAAAQCPDEHGKYNVVATGAGCADLSTTAPECILQSACTIKLVSSGPNGTKALNGSADLVNDGSFTGAAIKEGSVNRTGCVGSWDANTSTLTVDCGGVGTTQSCRAILTRTSMQCN